MTLAATALFFLSGCGTAPPASPTGTTGATIQSPVNACQVFTSPQLASALHLTHPTQTGDGTPRQGTNQNMYSNCHWDLNDGRGSFFELHTETYADADGAHGIVANNLAEDRANGTHFEFTPEPSLGTDAYFRQNRNSTMLTLVFGTSAYSLYLKTTDTLDGNATRPVLTSLAQQIR